MAATPTFRLASLDHEGQAPTTLCGYVGDLQIIMHGREAPRTSELTSCLRLQEINGVKRCIVCSFGGSPNAAQRQHAARYFQTDASDEIMLAVLTDTALHRYVITALNLFRISPVKAFPIRDMTKALVHVGASISDTELRAYLARMAQMLGIEAAIVAR